MPQWKQCRRLHYIMQGHPQRVKKIKMSAIIMQSKTCPFLKSVMHINGQNYCWYQDAPDLREISRRNACKNEYLRRNGHKKKIDFHVIFLKRNSKVVLGKKSQTDMKIEKTEKLKYEKMSETKPFVLI